MGKHKSSMKGYSLKDFTKLLNEKGFQEHHRNSAHIIFTNSENKFVTVPAHNKKELNHLMTTVILQRINNNQLKRLY